VLRGAFNSRQGSTLKGGIFILLLLTYRHSGFNTVFGKDKVLSSFPSVLLRHFFW
jgi:hypothetical protein